MISFIIVDDKNEICEKEKTIIDNYMMKYDIKYIIKTFNGYNADFSKEIKKDKGLKVYLLDIKTKDGSGIDIARIIREKQCDWKSIIMIITAYPEYKYEALCSRLYILDFIVKENSFEERIKKCMDIVLDNYHKKENSITYKYNSYFNVIDYKDIIYIEKEQDSKRCIIHTTYGDEVMPKSLIAIEQKLDTRFFKTHRSLIINIKQVKKYDYQNNRIIFKNGEYTELVSRDKKKKLVEYIKNNA